MGPHCRADKKKIPCSAVTVPNSTPSHTVKADGVAKPPQHSRTSAAVKLHTLLKAKLPKTPVAYLALKYFLQIFTRRAAKRDKIKVVGTFIVFSPTRVLLYAADQTQAL